MPRMTKAAKAAARAEATARYEAVEAIVRTGTCPDCGSALKRNLALDGWWSCEQRGDGHFRARPNDPRCSWQGFTRPYDWDRRS